MYVSLDLLIKTKTKMVCTDLTKTTLVHVHNDVSIADSGCTCTCTCTSMFLISSYGAPLAQRASYLALHCSLIGPVAQLIMIILSLTALTLC